MAMKAEKDRVVKIAYRITDTEGRLIEEKTPEDAYEYLHGHSQIVPPVERAITGKTAGYRAEVSVTPLDGYGDYDENLVAELPRAHFPKEMEIEVGMKFNTVGPSGKPVIIRVIELSEDTVTVDGNHPLAGLEIIFDLRVLNVREATRQELEAGRTELPATIKGSDSLH